MANCCKVVASLLYFALHSPQEDPELLKADLLGLLERLNFGEEINWLISDSTDVRKCLAYALDALFSTTSFEDAIKKAAMHGGEMSDAVGTLTGQLAGAVYGHNAIPERWVNEVENWDHNGSIAKRGYLLLV